MFDSRHQGASRAPKVAADSHLEPSVTTIFKPTDQSLELTGSGLGIADKPTTVETSMEKTATIPRSKGQTIRSPESRDEKRSAVCALCRGIVADSI